MKSLHKPKAFRLLAEGMSELQKQHQRRIQNGEDPAFVDREVAQCGLTGVVAFLQECEIETGPLVRLLAELVALTAGSKPSRMLAPTTTRHRRPTPPMIDAVKGRLAAIMAYQQQSGLDRKQAGSWVARHLPPEMKRLLKSNSRAAIDSWLSRWGGSRTPSSPGRDGYRHMAVILSTKKPTEPQLKKIIQVLAKSLPS